MESHAPHHSSSPRKFSRILVGRCHAQTATDRFGQGAKNAVRDRERAAFGLPPLGGEIPFTWPGVESDTDEVIESSIYRQVPSMQTYRNNLTALSQVYNLYLVAYQGRIFAYRPRSVPTQNVPGIPDLQLSPRPSRAARSIGGYLDTRRPHVINNLIVGFLGKDEVVVACFDDGDVVAYYVRDIADSVSSMIGVPKPPSRRFRKGRRAFAPPKPRQFLHENVGSSSWGLAVHAKSRLVAVSSNHHEITVFAPAIIKKKPSKKAPHGSCECEECCHGIEERIQQRARNWRIIVALGEDADNVPNITFMDDEEGNAEKVCAVDINGVVWLAEIWEPFKAPMRLPGYRSLPSEEFFHDSSRGWGLVALPESSFMKVQTVEEMLGMEPRETDVALPTRECPQPMVNVRRRLQDVPDNPCRPRDAEPGAARPGTTLHGFIQDQLLHVFAQAQVNVGDELTLEGAEPLLDQVGEIEWEDEDMDELDEGEDDQDYEIHFDDGFDEEDEEDEEADESEEETEPEATDPVVADPETANPEAGSSEDSSEDDSDAVEEEEGAEDEEDEDSEEVEEQENEVQGQPGAEQPGTSQPSVTMGPPAAHLSALLAGPFQHAFGQLHDAMGELEQAIESLESGDVPTLLGQWGGSLPATTRTGRQSSTAHLPNLPSRTIGEPPIRLDMYFYPHCCYYEALPQEHGRLVRFLKRPAGPTKRVAGVDQMGEQANQRYHILRTYEKDLELRSLGAEKEKNKREIGVLCPDAVKFGGFTEPGLRHYFHATGRLSMVVQVPDLFLVAIGSPTGRVVLLTPTKLASRKQHSVGVWAYGFRVEHILPRESDEKEHRKVLRPLHGLAMGPLQLGEKVSEDERLGRPVLPKRYRLMLHYRTHDILTYEIERDGQTGKLCIF